MNFDDDDDSDFSFGGNQTSKLESLFKTNAMESATNDSLKYKPPKQPQVNQAQAQPQASTAQSSTNSAQILFFSGVQAFKYENNKYEPLGKLGLAILNNQGQYRLILYASRTQPLASLKVNSEFKASLQKNNYVSFYDESKRLWSVLFENEELVITFNTQIALCKFNLMGGNLSEPFVQDLKFTSSDSNQLVEASDSVEISTVISLWKENKVDNVIENTSQKPLRVKLGKNKLPNKIEELLIGMKQGERRLFVLNSNSLQPIYSNLANNSIVFYDVHVLRIKKNVNEPLPSEPTQADQVSRVDIEESRSRAQSIKEKSKYLDEQKAKLISRMAKMGQQTIIPQVSHHTPETESENWDKQQPSTNKRVQQEPVAQPTSTNTASYLSQENYQLEEQLAIKNRLLQQQLQQQQNQISQLNSQFAPYRAVNMSTALAQPQQTLVYPQNAIAFPNYNPAPVVNNQIEQQQPLNQTNPELTGKILVKLEILNEKMDHLKTLTQANNQALPNIDTSVLLQGIQRIVKENEQYKKDLFEKSAKIEEQNGKITELLTKSQSYVEKSHEILELKNSSFQQTAEKSTYKILELEEDKLRLTSDLSKLTSQISELNLQMNRMQKEEFDTKQKLNDVSKTVDSYKQENERLLVDNADLRTKLDNTSNELKKERQLRKSLEIKIERTEEENTEFRSEMSSNQKSSEEKRRKVELEKKQLENEMDTLKRQHLTEINELKEKINKLKANSNEEQSERVNQIEADLNKEWQQRLQSALKQTEQKYERQLASIQEEKQNAEKQQIDLEKLVKSLKSSQSKYDTEIDSLKHKLEESAIVKEKYERLQAQALVMKERYESRIKELLEAEPDVEIIAEQMKKLMNVVYRKLKAQIKPDEYYQGFGILTAMLKIIKTVTLKLVDAKASDNVSEKILEVDDVDYFSEYIYKPIVPVVDKPAVNEIPTVTEPAQQLKEKSEPEFNTNTNSEASYVHIEEKQTKERVDALHSQQAHIPIHTEVSKESQEVILRNIPDDDRQEEEEDDDIQLITEENEEKENLVNQIKSIYLHSHQENLGVDEVAVRSRSSTIKEPEPSIENDNPNTEHKVENETQLETDLHHEEKEQTETQNEASPTKHVDLNDVPDDDFQSEESSPIATFKIDKEEDEEGAQSKSYISDDQANKPPVKNKLFDDEDDEDADEKEAKDRTEVSNKHTAQNESGESIKPKEKTGEEKKPQSNPLSLFDDDEDKEEIDWFK